MEQVKRVNLSRGTRMSRGFLIGVSLVFVSALLSACSTLARTPVPTASAEAPQPGQQHQQQAQLEEALRQVEALRKQSALDPQDQLRARLKEALQRIEALEKQIKAKQGQEIDEKLAKEKEEETKQNWALTTILGM